MNIGLEQLRQVLDAVPDPTLAVDRSGRILTHGRKACKVFGFEPSELHHTDLSVFIPERLREEYFAAFDAVFDAPDAQLNGPGRRLRGLRRDGTEFPVEVRVSPTTVDDQPIALVSVRDITERETLREHFHQAQRMESVGQFASGISHDFNNLLTVILCNCRMLAEILRHGDADTRELIAEVQTAATQATELTRQILTNSRRPHSDETAAIDLNELIRKVRNTLTRLAGEEVQVETRLDAGIGGVEVDPTKLEQALLNLTGNARDAMPRGGRLQIETANVERAADEQPPRSYVCLSIADNGVGMAPEIITRAFEPFFTTKQGEKGTGLGLVLVRTLVEATGGFVEVKSEPGEGTRFDLYFPRCAADQTVSIEPARARPRRSGNETVLLVEDSDEALSSMSRILESNGLDVLKAAHPNDAIRFAAQRAVPIDLLVVDVVLPLLDGPKLVQRLLQSQPEARVLFVSGYDDELLRERGAFELGSVLRKPFEPVDLMQCIEEILDGTPT